MEKESSECVARRATATNELAAQLPGESVEHVTTGLVFGLDCLRTLLFRRIHSDVEQQFGQDSMLLPVSMEEAAKAAKREIDAFQIAESTCMVRAQEYLEGDGNWYARWLGKLCLGEAMQEDRWRRRIRQYLSLDDDQRRLEFSRHLERVFPEATRAPLILYRLFPLAVQIVTAVAFGDNLHAVELRNRQMFWLPSISDCHECHGRPLDNGEECHICGNPLWNYMWLCELD